jgi:ligand-binding sensor domain-containing protein
MLKPLQYIFLVFLLFGCHEHLLSQNFYFNHPEDKNLFLRGTILDIIQDRQGFLWIATTDGLGRYDGNAVVEYRNDRFDTTSLSNNYTSNLIEDKKGRIWISTKNGLNCYLPDVDRFIRYFYKGEENSKERNYVLNVMEDRFGFIWRTTYDGVFRLDPKTGEQFHFKADTGNAQSIVNDIVWDIMEDNKGRLWFAANNGISVLS